MFSQKIENIFGSFDPQNKAKAIGTKMCHSLKGNNKSRACADLSRSSEAWEDQLASKGH
jgi:hypothetical protein